MRQDSGNGSVMAFRVQRSGCSLEQAVYVLVLLMTNHRSVFCPVIAFFRKSWHWAKFQLVRLLALPLFDSPTRDRVVFLRFRRFGHPRASLALCQALRVRCSCRFASARGDFVLGNRCVLYDTFHCNSEGKMFPRTRFHLFLEAIHFFPQRFISFCQRFVNINSVW